MTKERMKATTPTMGQQNDSRVDNPDVYISIWGTKHNKDDDNENMP